MSAAARWGEDGSSRSAQHAQQAADDHVCVGDQAHAGGDLPFVAAEPVLEPPERLFGALGLDIRNANGTSTSVQLMMTNTATAITATVVGVLLLIRWCSARR
jgi:hypothetical protein